MENNYAGSEEYWKQYIRGRPKIPDSLFERIFAYHRKRGGQFDYAHDAGAGAGVHSPRLATAFSRVLVTDIDQKNVDAAQSNLGGDGRYSFRVASLEAVDSAPAYSLDLFFASNSFHWCDNARAMQAAATQLKPGGTLALLVFGLPILQDAEVQELWLELYRTGFNKRKKTDYMRYVMGHAWHMYDWVSVPDALFLPGAERIYFNVPKDWSHTVQGFTGIERPPDGIGPNDRISIEDDNAWAAELSLEDLGYTAKSFNLDLSDPDMAQLWLDMESVVGERKIQTFTFGHLVLATRR